MGEDRAVGRRVAGADRLEQRGLEPSAVLVRALEIEVGRPAELRAHREHRGVAAAGVEPHVEDVRFLAEALARASWAARAGGQEGRRVAHVPLVRARTVPHDPGHVLHQRLVEQELIAPGAVEGHDRHAPHALARDHPLRAVRDHVVDALLAPCWYPTHNMADRVEGLLPEAAPIQRDEPLLGGAEERRVLAAPAVRIGMGERHLRDEGPDRTEVLDDARVRLPHRHAREVRDLAR